MKLFIFGASGATGQLVVTQALQQGHEVSVFVRNPGKLMTIENSRFKIFKGSVTDDPKAVSQAMKGHDVVISALGNGSLWKDLNATDFISRSMRVIVAAMESNGIRRLIFTSAFGIGESRQDAPTIPKLFYRLLLSACHADKAASEAFLRQSSLDWTLVYPVALNHGPRTGKYRIGERLQLKGVPMISRSDTADFILSQLEDKTYLRKFAVISY